MAKLNPDEVMGEIHTVVGLTLMLTGQEVLDHAKLLQYVLEHPDQFADEESRAVGRTGLRLQPWSGTYQLEFQVPADLRQRTAR
jgi:hypothetical protein